MIVKVQISLNTHGGEHKSVLIYNKDRSFIHEGIASNHILKLMGGEMKLFFYAKSDNKEKIKLLNRAPWQEW